MKIASYTNTVNFLQTINTSSKGDGNSQALKKDQDTVIIGKEARSLFDSQIQLQDAPEEIAQKIASMFKRMGVN
ncbi:hypothetical protein C3943_14575 [Lysinibacillus sp. B2A1]|nr:hypothetical protein C3943_14575 [Lysinibacillus sp. B2A1]